MSRLKRTLRWLFSRIIMTSYFVPVCLLAGFAIRIVWIVLLDVEPVNDPLHYYQGALSILNGEGYAAYGRLMAYWPVGYPAFLAILFTVFGHSLFIAKLANVLMYMVIIVLSYHLARRLFDSEVTARVTLLLLAFYPNHIAYTSLLFTEIQFLFLIIGGFALLLLPTRRTWIFAILAGIVFGLAMLTRAVALLLPALFFVAMLATNIKEQRVRASLLSTTITYCAMALIVAPWAIRNHMVFDAFVPVSNNGGVNLLIGNNPKATGGFIKPEEELEEFGFDKGTEVEIDRLARSMAIEYIKNNPGQVLLLMPRKVFHLYLIDGEGFRWNQKSLRTDDTVAWWLLALGIIIAQLYYMAAMALFVVALFVLYKNRKTVQTPRFSLFGLWIMLYFTGIYMIFFGANRFHFPVMPWVMMYVGALAAIVLTKHEEEAERSSTSTPVPEPASG